MLDVKLFVSDCVGKKYHRPCITITEGCCRKCLKGTPTGHNLKKKSIKQLMDEGIIDPYQLASAFHFGSAYQAPYFKDSILNLQSEANPCKRPGNCNLTCVLCSSLIMNSDEVELSIWPGFKVHKACTGLCLHPCCKERLPTLPAYLSQRSTLMCERHQDSNAFQRLTIRPLVPPSISRPLVPPSRPISLKPPPEPRVVPPEPPIKKTHCFKKQPKAKAEKFDERGKSVNILSFFGGATNKALPTDVKVQQAALAASKREDAPRRFIRRKDTGEIFGYWKNDQAFSTEDDQPLNFKSDFNRVPYSSNIKFDFTPPVTLSNP